MYYSTDMLAELTSWSASRTMKMSLCGVGKWSVRHYICSKYWRVRLVCVEQYIVLEIYMLLVSPSSDAGAQLQVLPAPVPGGGGCRDGERALHR